MTACKTFGRHGCISQRHGCIAPRKSQQKHPACRYHRNQQYSVTALTDTTGTISERYAYDAYGKVTVLAGGGSVLSGSTYGNRYTYTGREWDDELGLYHYRARMYDPVAGRFVSRDPIGYKSSDNLFLFVGNKPTRFTDPHGLWEWGAGDWLDRTCSGGRYGDPSTSGSIYGYCYDVCAVAPVAGEISDCYQVVVGTDQHGNHLDCQDRVVTVVAAGLPFVPGRPVRGCWRWVRKKAGSCCNWVKRARLQREIDSLLGNSGSIDDDIARLNENLRDTIEQLDGLPYDDPTRIAQEANVEDYVERIRELEKDRKEIWEKLDSLTNDMNDCR